jgi:hypothetical protein
MRLMKRLLLTLGLVMLVAGSVWAYETLNNYYVTAQVKTRLSKLNEDEDNLFFALQQYKERMGAYPAGGNADVARALQGNNSKSLIILVGRRQNINEKGEFVDPWSTPLRIYFSGEGVLIRSAGPNKRFDDSSVPNSDDIYRSN